MTAVTGNADVVSPHTGTAVQHSVGGNNILLVHPAAQAVDLPVHSEILEA